MELECCAIVLGFCCLGSLYQRHMKAICEGPALQIRLIHVVRYAMNCRGDAVHIHIARGVSESHLTNANADIEGGVQFTILGTTVYQKHLNDPHQVYITSRYTIVKEKQISNSWIK